ncbi:MAG: hypothetical protein JWN13_3025 [Betaproteobacteria bacterium]|jgi:hypothetical protein|nr:hypothetical protein [Betaproteobacteria bacterium]MEA3157425.1 hypothetical protein [Betaproteobacteria bacterium]
MKLFNHIVQTLTGSTPHADDDYVPGNTYDWREPLLVEAARKHGKPFKCAGGELPREVMLRGKDLVVVDVETRALHGSAQLTHSFVQSKRGESALARLAGSGVLTQGRHED